MRSLPLERLPVQTFVMEHDWGVLADAMRRELDRGGQVYYLHNRVDNIERTALKISELLDGASVAVAHGKMDSEQLGRIMEDMAEGRVQILVCTTIIETGIDIPNVNTLLIEDADRLGLAQLHLDTRPRGPQRARRASAYLTFRRDKVLSEVAEKRLEANTRVRRVQLRLPHRHARPRDTRRGLAPRRGAERPPHGTWATICTCGSWRRP